MKSVRNEENEIEIEMWCDKRTGEVGVTPSKRLVDNKNFEVKMKGV